MSSREPYNFPLNQQEISEDFWQIVLDQLIDKSNHKKQLVEFLTEHQILSQPELKLSKLKVGPSSLNEEMSRNHITPFHLSYYGKTMLDSKRKGQFFTPSYISDFIAKKSLEYFIKENEWNNLDQNLKKLRMADIATGTGNLILSLLYTIMKKLSPLTGNQKKLLHSFISENLFAFDLDPFSILIQKLRIKFFSSQFLPEFSLPNLDSNIDIGNSLLDTRELFLQDRNASFKPVEMLLSKNELFDIIVLNPPFMSYGLKNAQKYHPEYKEFLRHRFKSAEYKLSMYAMFIERSVELLKEGGILGIITPDAHLLGRYYSKLRSYILENLTILEITMLGFEPFQGVTLGRPVISFYKKSFRKNAKNRSFPARLIYTLGNFLKSEWQTFDNIQSDFENNKYNRFYLYFDKQTKKTVMNWKQLATTQLSDIVTMHTGIRSRIGQKNICSKTQKDENWKRGIVSSRQVVPFNIIYDRDWINISPNLLWSGGYNAEIIERPKIILRQTGDKIIAAVDDRELYHLNNCHTIAPKTQELNLFALATQLNSIEFNEVYNILSMEKGRALAQIDMDFLLERNVIETTRRENKILETFYKEQSKKVSSDMKSNNYSLRKLLNRD